MSGGEDPAPGWRKSRWSSTGNCVEVRFAGDCVHVRNSRDRTGAVLTFTSAEWSAFLVGAGEGDFAVPTTTPLAPPPR